MFPDSCSSCAFATAALALCSAGACPLVHAARADQGVRVREPAVAGQFYPGDPGALAGQIDAYLARAQRQPVGELKALICPHAGYAYSGPVAAFAFRLLEGRHYGTVVVMGPSHYAYMNACALPGADAYRTPLGDVPVSRKAGLLARSWPFAVDPPCDVQRPGWAGGARRPGGARDTAETWEHSVEVEVPFLQRTLGDFEIVPAICGDVDPAQAARALDPVLDDGTLIVASSDLSHYHAYDEARRLDRDCVRAICSLDLRAMEGQQACGRIPILILMNIARERGWRARLLDWRNSGDTSGDSAHGVVGYAAIAFYAPSLRPLGAAQRRALLGIARRALREPAAAGGEPGAAPADRALAVARGCFVTLTRDGALRGCIGTLGADRPLFRAVAENARAAALGDPRFHPVTAGEVDALRIEVSVLSEAQQLHFSSPEDLLLKLQPGVDGVVLRIGNRTATYLPQVWEQLGDRARFMDSLSVKAGCAASDWRKPGASVFLYEVESFGEPGA
jgi:AmmeMemoRadiSam system protein B/AmmeMemoRadiSam system protein A